MRSEEVLRQVGGKVFLNVPDDPVAALLGFFPVENAGTGGNISTHGSQTNFYMVIEHNDAFFRQNIRGEC